MTRAQRHSATFQCSLCPKRFTRAFNLRGHLRTHTDERPFVCSVCGKAFARRHDQRTHEGLHSGERKFVCRGTLLNDREWGCRRRFARASNLGRHFRSDIGRICIRPLLEEEAAKNERNPADESTNASRRGQVDYVELLASGHQADTEHSAITSSTDTERNRDTGTFSTAPSAQRSVSQAVPPAKASDIQTNAHVDNARFHYALWPAQEPDNDSYETRKRVAYDSLNDFFGQRPVMNPDPIPRPRHRPHADLNERGRTQLLEKILRDKGFDVDAELRKAKMPPELRDIEFDAPEINIDFAPPARVSGGDFLHRLSGPSTS